MKLPNAELAFIDIDKLRDYCLSKSHPRGRHKARVFTEALGLGEGDAEVLQAALQEAAIMAEATASTLTSTGSASC